MTQFSTTLQQQANPVYVGKFNLSNKPFSNQLNSTLFYENEGRKIALKKIPHLLEFTHLILFIQGASGLGKTTLIRQLNRQKSKNWRTCFLNAQDFTTPESLVDKIAKDMVINLDQAIPEKQTQSLQEILDGMHQAGITSVLFIDDIEKINAAIIPTLASLIRCKENKSPNIRLVVIGQDLPKSVEQIIPVNNDESSLKYLPLPPLTEKECTDYIKHRLNSSNYQYIEPFNKNQIKKIYLDAKGFPLIINHLSDLLFTQYALDYENQKPIINLNEKTNKILKYVAGGLSALVVIFVTYSFFSSKSEPVTLANLKPENSQQLIAIPPKRERIVIEKSAKTEVKKQTTSNKAVIKAEDKKPISSIEKKILQVKLKNENSKKSEKTTITKPTEKAKTAPVARKIKPKPSTKNNAWIKSQNPKHFTLQLIGGSNRAAAVKFIKKHKLQKHSAIFVSKRKGENWYSVVYKSFKTSAAANKAVKKLPRSLRRIKPWTRPFSAIQRHMN